MSRIGIDIVKEGPIQTKESKCSNGQWSTIHWSGHLMDGRMITDTRSEPGGMPKKFAQGVSEVFKCIDLAMTQLHKGDQARLTCPASLVYGGFEANAPLGGERVPKHSDMVFDIDVLDCNEIPSNNQEVQPKTTTM